MRQAFWLIQIAAILFAPPVIYVFLPQHRGHRRAALRGAAFIVVCMYALFFGAFMVGETLSDPGGWAAVAMLAPWVGPMVALTFVAWRYPGRAEPVLAALTLAVAGLYVWSAFNPEAWAAFEDSNGPVRAVISFSIVVPTAVLGWSRPHAAGLILVSLPVFPMLLVVLATAGFPTAGVWPIAIVTAPAGIAAILFLAADPPSGQEDAQERKRSRRRIPLFNRLMIRLLTSRLHGLVSRSLVLLTVRGVRSDRSFTFPVMYARDGQDLVIVPGRPQTKRWWRNLSAHRAVMVRLRGRELAAGAEVVRGSEDRSKAGRLASIYVTRFPRARRVLGSDVASQVFVVLHPSPAAAISREAA